MDSRGVVSGRCTEVTVGESLQLISTCMVGKKMSNQNDSN